MEEKTLQNEQDYYLTLPLLPHQKTAVDLFEQSPTGFCNLSEMGTGKCILPHSQIVINGQVLSIEHAYELQADKTSQIIDDENFNASWFVPNTKLLVPSYCEKSRKIVDKEVKHIYKQKVSEEIRKVTTDGNYSIDTTKAHKFLTPNGWTNQIKIGDYVLTHKGRYMPVVSLMKRQYDGMLNIFKSPLLTKNIYTTPEHPFYEGNGVWRPSSESSKLVFGKCKTNTNKENLRIDLLSYVKNIKRPVYYIYLNL